MSTRLLAAVLAAGPALLGGGSVWSTWPGWPGSTVLEMDPDGSNPRWVQAPPVLQNGGEFHVGDCFRVVRDGVAEKIGCP